MENFSASNSNNEGMEAENLNMNSGNYRDQGQDGVQQPQHQSAIGRTYSASAVDFGWRRKKKIGDDNELSPSECDQDQQASTRPSDRQLIGAGTKRKFSSQEYSPSSASSSSNSPCRLPQFISCLPSDLTANAQHPAGSPNCAEFITPSQPKKQSRPNSPSNVGSRLLILPRSRVASIRRESDCAIEKKFGESEAAHEKLVKSTQQVSVGFEDFCLDEKLFEERKRTKSLTEPISIFTNAFLPQTSTPSPNRGAIEAQKQCYSPSAQQVVKSNLAYSPSPSPTPASSPSMHRMRSMSPIAVRQLSKRRYTGTSSNFGGGGHNSGLESDGECPVSSSFSLSAPVAKRQCTVSTSPSQMILLRGIANSSPLVRDSIPDLQLPHPLRPIICSSSSSMTDIFATSSSPSSSLNSANFEGSPAVYSSSKFLVDPNISSQCFPQSTSSYDGQEEDEDEPREGQLLMSSFCSTSSLFNDANSSTTFSSRANTPESQSQGAGENDLASVSSSSLFPRLLPSHHPPTSACSSSDDCGGSSSRCSSSQNNQQQLDQMVPTTTATDQSSAIARTIHPSLESSPSSTSLPPPNSTSSISIIPSASWEASKDEVHDKVSEENDANDG